MNLSDAAYATAHDYAGGTPSLAPRMGISGAMLRNKVNPNDATHHLTLSEAMRMQSLTGDHRILHAMSDELGYVCIQLPVAGASDMALLDSFMAITKELGEFASEFQKDWADGRIDGKEIERLRKEFYELQQSAAAFMGMIEALAEQSHG